MGEKTAVEKTALPQPTPPESSECRIVFGDGLNAASSEVTFDSDDLPGVDEYQGDALVAAYLASFNTALECASRRAGVSEALSKIHAAALGSVNWQRTIAFLEDEEFAASYQYTSGMFRVELPSRLSFADASRGIVYDAPDGARALEMVKAVDEFVSAQVETIPRVDERYFNLAAASSLMIFLAHPFAGGNKRVIRPFVTYILTSGGLTGRWLERDTEFVEGFKKAWTGLVGEFQEETGLEAAKDGSEYDEKWLKYWTGKLESGEILDDEHVKGFAETIKQAPYYAHAMGQKVASSQ